MADEYRSVHVRADKYSRLFPGVFQGGLYTIERILKNWILLGLLLLAVSTRAQGQLSYETNDGAITITGYTGGGALTIPTNINGFTVTSIAPGAFSGSSLTSITMGDSITSIGEGAFEYSALTSIVIPGSVIDIGSDAFTECTSLTNAVLANGVTGVGVDMFASCETLASVTIPNSVSSIGQYAFESCSSLTNIVIPASVSHIGAYAFEECSSLASVFFGGNAPSDGSSAFGLDDIATVFYLPGSKGWTNFTDPPAVLWNPLIQTNGANFGVVSNQFGFNITGTANIPIAVEECTNLASPVWISLATMTLTNGLVYFSDCQWTNAAAQFYRISSP